MVTNTIRTRTQEIPRRRWRAFFEEFSRRHDGWLVDIEELMSDRGAQKEVTGLPFHGASAVASPRPSVVIEVGWGPDGHIEHRIDGCRKIWVETLSGGAEAAVEIESAGGRRTLLEFRSPQPTEAVDGMAAPARRRVSPRTPASKRR
jgi:hypothetical protein